MKRALLVVLAGLVLASPAFGQNKTIEQYMEYLGTLEESQKSLKIQFGIPLIAKKGNNHCVIDFRKNGGKNPDRGGNIHCEKKVNLLY